MPDTNEKWVTVCKRTEDPKLRHFEGRLDESGIEHRRNGESWHAPVLQVPSEQAEKAWDMLNTVYDMGDGIHQRYDDIPDDDPMFSGENYIEYLNIGIPGTHRKG